MAANSATAIPNAGMGAGTNNASAIVFRPIGWGDLDAVVDLFDRTWPQDVDKVGADMSRLISRYFVLHYLLPTTFANGAFAADGGGGSGDGTGTGDGSAGGTGKITWVYKDSFGSPTRENVKSAMGSVGVKSMDGSESNSAIDEAVNGANAECVARSKASGNQNPTCRLVSVGFVHTPGANGDWYTGANGSFSADQWKAAYNASGIPNGTYSYQGANYTTRSFFSDGQTSINSLATREMNKAPRAVVAIVLDQDEPPVDYDLTVSTQAGGLFTQAGSTDDVSDAITTSRGGSTISEDVTGTVTLHWTGLDGTTRTASKQFTQNNNTTKSVSFGYRDVDKAWKVWPAGFYYYDVTVGKQGHMKAAASHMGAQDAKESWKPVSPPPSKSSPTWRASRSPPRPSRSLPAACIRRISPPSRTRPSISGCTTRST